MTHEEIKQTHDAEMRGSEASEEPPRYGRAKVSTIYRDFDRHREAVRAQDIEAVEETWGKVERWIGYVFEERPVPDPAAFEQMREALRPFEATVFNDNGDVTISTGHITRADWLALAAALKAAEGK